MVTCCTAAYRRSRETPIPELSTRFRALKHRNFQLFIIGQLISLVGTWMQTTAQQWLVYKLTGSVAVLGVFGFASQVPMLLLAWMGGYVGDRYNRHRGVIVTQSLSMILAFVLAALTLTHLIREWHLIVIALLAGIVNAFDVRSEEHTSELQSLRHLVCRLLLEKKNIDYRALQD